MARALPIPLLSALLVACPAPPDPEPTPGPPVRTDVPWSPSPPENDIDVRGYRELRTIAHFHSHWSHDACDGDPQPDGVPDELCLLDLRAGLCDAGIDVAFLSDHPTHADETDYETLLLLRDGDEAIDNAAGDPVANRMVCPDGRTVLLLPGVESDLMPLGLQAHAVAAYRSFDAEAVTAAHDAGALAWVAHTEQRTLAELEALDIDGIEGYQLHANLAPNIREEALGLDPFGYLGDVGPFFFPETLGLAEPPHPDLAPLGFVIPIEPSVVMLEQLGQSKRIGVTGGTDAHQNVFPQTAWDGERMDSYRRMMRWFNNRLRLQGDITPDAVRSALGAGHVFTVFEVFGTPVGFDLRIDGGASTVEIGDEANFEDGMTLQFCIPSLDLRSPGDTNPPQVDGLLFRATPDREEIGRWDDAAGECASVAVPGPGVYRAEVWITPKHLRPALGEIADEYTLRRVPWVQTGGLFLR
jgi:hypothetical protein